MNCFFHPEETAVASCMDCGKSLCKACAGKYEIAICDNCNINRNSADKKKAIKEFRPALIFFIIGFVIMIVSLIMLQSDDPISIVGIILLSILMGWLLGGAVWGLIHTRSWFQPKTVTVKTTPGLDANDFMKSFASVARIFVSVFVGPFLIIKSLVKFIKAMNKSKKVTNSINANKI